MILYRAAQHREMELLRNISVEKAVIIIQAYNRAWRTRKLYARLNHIRLTLREAITSRDLETLKGAIKYHEEESDFDIYPEYKNSCALRDLILEEMRVAKELTEVIKIIGNQLDPSQANIERLMKVVKAAEAINFEPPDYSEAKEMFVAINNRIEARKALQTGVQANDEESILEAVARAEEIGLSEAEPTLIAARKELERINEEKEHIAELRACLSVPATGEPVLSYEGHHLCPGVSFDDRGELSLSADAKERLENSLANAESFVCRTVEGKKFVESARFVIQLRDTILADDWDRISQLLRANHSGDNEKMFKTVEMKAAHEQLMLRAKQAEVQQALDDAAAAFDSDTLALELDKAYALRMEVASYQELHDRIVETHNALQQALENIVQEELEQAIAMAEEFGYPHEDYHQSVELRNILDQLSKEIDIALEIVQDREILEALDQRAVDCGLHTEPLEQMRELLALSEELLAKAQLKSAIARKDNDRTIEISIRLKEIFFRMFGDSFVFTQCGRLKTQSEFARGKLLGKDKVKAGMMSWSKQQIHTSLTRIGNEHVKQALIINKDLLGYLGDKIMSFPEMLAVEIIQIGVQTPELRDEVYCQVIKQLTDNPSQEATTKAKKLLGCCLRFFPPSREFENYLEIYFRKQSNDEYRRMLHQVIFSGASTEPITIELIRPYL